MSILCFSACGAGHGNGAAGSASDSGAVTRAPQFDRSLKVGKVWDSIACTGASDISYALYLPSGYTPDKKFPCLYFFDAHARGSMPLHMYAKVAEKFGFVFIGCNTSKNGMTWEANNAAISKMMADSRNRINIDSSRIYAAGFSGGSRVASTLAIKGNSIAGVIGCAAGFPNLQQPITSKFDYFGMAGDYDFNLPEMEMLDAGLEQNGFVHQLLTLSGKHGWPKVPDFQLAVIWLQVSSMKKNLSARNDSLIVQLRNEYKQRIAEELAAGEWVKAQSLLSGLVRLLNGYADCAAEQKQLTELVATRTFQNAASVQEKLHVEEQNLQQELMQEFAARDERWWINKIDELSDEMKHAPDLQEAQMYARVINYLGLICYMAIDRAITEGELERAKSCIAIFKKADPDNPDWAYFSAVCFAKKGDGQATTKALKEAARLGFSEIQLVQSNNDFSKLIPTEALNIIYNTIKQNSMGVER